MSKITFWAAPLPLYVTFCQLFCQPPSPPSQVMYLSNGPIPLAKKKLMQRKNYSQFTTKRPEFAVVSLAVNYIRKKFYNRYLNVSLQQSAKYSKSIIIITLKAKQFCGQCSGIFNITPFLRQFLISIHKKNVRKPLVF